MNLLNAYALVPCTKENQGVRLTCTNQVKGYVLCAFLGCQQLMFDVRKKTVQLRTDGSPSCRASVSALWGPKSLEQMVDLDLNFQVETEKSVLRRQAHNQNDVT